MALFRRGDKPASNDRGAAASVRPVAGRKALCRVCDTHRPFTRCWLRINFVPQCPCCGLAFEHPEVLYQRPLPLCPRCGEFLEHPQFEYGLCDSCGSKHELTSGARPTLLPNKAQRDAMDKHGKAYWR